MDIEAIREHCLSLPHATEDIKPEWGDALLFRIAGKIFVSTSLTAVPLTINVKCTPERCAELLEIEGVRRADYVGRYDWITFPVAGVFRDAEIRNLIAESYENIRAKLPRSVAAKLVAPKPAKSKSKASHGRRATHSTTRKPRDTMRLHRFLHSSFVITFGI